MKLTVTTIDNALRGNSFWLNKESEEAAIINEAEKRGYIRRLSHTQAEWSEEGLEKARRELSTAPEPAPAKKAAKTKSFAVWGGYALPEVRRAESIEALVAGLLAGKVTPKNWGLVEYYDEQGRRIALDRDALENEPLEDCVRGWLDNATADELDEDIQVMPTRREDFGTGRSFFLPRPGFPISQRISPAVKSEWMIREEGSYEDCKAGKGEQTCSPEEHVYKILFRSPETRVVANNKAEAEAIRKSADYQRDFDGDDEAIRKSRAIGKFAGFGLKENS